MERKDMQPFVGKVLADAFEKAEVPMDLDHSRRLVRVLLRGAARIALRFEVSLPIWTAMCVDMMITESKTEYPAEIPGGLPEEDKKPNLYVVPGGEDDEKDLN